MKIQEQIPSDWLGLLSSEWTQGQIESWSDGIESLIHDKDIAPAKDRIFRALEACSFDDTKVVIIGQDPYPTLGHANGLAFSTEEFVQPFPKSLLNIFKELKRSIPDYDFPLTGNLKSWADQGVLLLNTCLTTEIGEANAHKNKGWEEFTSVIVQKIFETKSNVVGLFWGRQAQDFTNGINETNHFILKTSHPSPLSVYRGFEGCNHFLQCNEFLTQNGQKPIDWQT